MAVREDYARLRRCESCKRYTLKSICPDCGERAIEPHPPKYSPEDKYASYRRKYKEEHVK
ncbi:RNA-protein complex protein Nop10 [Candidatus Woesearchaeota archaeon]|nr:RNA-protein complex protein Nop10 [Candidatus Woesearchaeota archaeon]